MKDCPCKDCKQRIPVCHDRCSDYMEWHDALVAAKDALRVADKAMDLIMEGFRKRSDRWHRRNDK